MVCCPGLAVGKYLARVASPPCQSPPVLIEGWEREGSSPKSLHVPYEESP